MGCPRFDGVSKYRWPLLCCVCLGDDMCCGVAARWARRSSATLNPGDVAAKAMAKIQRGLIQGQLRGRCPKLELVTVTVAAMAVVATDRHVHRERAATSRRGLMQRTNSVPLYPRSLRGLEPKQAQNLLHRDLSANSVEVDTWHGCSSLGDVPPRVISRRAANQRTCGRAGRLAPATPTPRPIARSGPPGNRGASLASAPCPGPEGRVLAPPDRVAFRPGAPR